MLLPLVPSHLECLALLVLLVVVSTHEHGVLNHAALVGMGWGWEGWQEVSWKVGRRLGVRLGGGTSEHGALNHAALGAWVCEQGLGLGLELGLLGDW